MHPGLTAAPGTHATARGSSGVQQQRLQPGGEVRHQGVVLRRGDAAALLALLQHL